MLSRRTDLALEARKLWDEENTDRLSGVTEDESAVRGFPVTRVKITEDDAARKLCKPKGTYVTIELGRLLRREDDAFTDGAETLSEVIRDMLPEGDVPILVVGLGNPAITPDAIGHEVIKNTLVTRHLRRQLPKEFEAFGDVAAIEPGVLGTTGIESASVVRSVVRDVRPAAVIAVDALASRSVDRLCRTVQVSDTGIVPGSGVGNAREALDAATLGVPVIAVGVPTVVDAATLAKDICGGNADVAREGALNMMVTPREIDSNVSDISRLIGYGIDLALHTELSVADIDMFIG